MTVPYVQGVLEAVRRTYPDPTGHEGLLQAKHDDEVYTSETKGPHPKSEMTGVMYQVPCASCPATSVGQTGRRLDQ